MEWITPQIVLTFLFTVLLTICGFMLRHWAKNWESRLVTTTNRLNNHSTRLAEHDAELVGVAKDLGHIKEYSEETRTDVKKLLDLANGRNNQSQG